MTNVFNTFKKSDQHFSCFPLMAWTCQFVFGLILCSALPSVASDKEEKKVEKKDVPRLVTDLLSTIKKRGYHWDISVFTKNGWEIGGYSVQGYPLIYFTCGKPENKNKSLILSAVHGDEVTPVFFGFRLVEWLKARPHLCDDAYVVVAPMVNPDGFMRYSRGTRTNWNKVDLNRNFDTPEWTERAQTLWRTKYKQQRRYFPGETSASEPEIEFQKKLIADFSPSKILSIHAPLNFLDYDGPQDVETAEFTKSYVAACEELKAAVKKAANPLQFYAYGVFPGSLGNYAGKHRGIPTFTVELPTVKWEYAAKYFGDLEPGTELFIRYPLRELQTRRMTKTD